VSKEDRGWAQEAVFGVLRLRGRIDHYLDAHVRRGVATVPPPLLRVLRLGAYQLLYMARVPAYAAVSEAVTQARSLGGARGAALANGVLRALSTGAESVRFPSFDADPVGYLTTWGSHPRWLVERWVARHGAERARGMTEAGCRVPSLYVRPIGLPITEALEGIRSHGIDAVPGPDDSSTIEVAAGSDPTAVLAAIPAIVQDPAASLVVGLARPVRGALVADLCAAPGGKGIALVGEGARVVGLDPSAGRLARMGEALRRLGLPERLVVARGESPPLRAVDLVLADVPCTGTGTLARHPDARWKLGADDPARMAQLQRAILEGAAGVVRPGGRLVYATCTLEEEENEGVVRSFLEAHPEFEADGQGATLRVLPGETSTDGAFAVRMRRAG
jgi:16S rRNA (cytosine967-C5)-methyltransferase